MNRFKKLLFFILIFFSFGMYVYASDYIIYSNHNDGGKLYKKNAYDTGNGIAINNVESLYPEYSPDGNYIVYINYNDGGILYRKSANDNGNGTAINTIPSEDPTYSPDGNYIIYTSNANWLLYRKNANDNGNGTPINTSVGITSTYSPDGNYIVYKGNGGKLYRKNANDNSNGTAINSVDSICPAYSPDGNYIVYTNNNDGGKLYRKNANDNSNGIAITNIEGIDAEYSPDGSYIIYANGYGGLLYRKNANDNSNGTPINNASSDFPIHSPVTFISYPTNLKQFIKLPEAPELPQQEIGVGSKVGKFQSGSGVVLSAYYDNNTNMSVNFEFEVYRLGEQNPVHLFESEDVSTGTGKVEVPFSMLGVGEYFWKARVKRSDGAVSNWVDYNTNYAWEYDFSYFSGFEPYPYGYNFKNNFPISGLLTGGVGFNSSTKEKHKIDGTRWSIFNKAFPEYIFESKEKMISVFEKKGFDSDKPYKDGNCFGMAFTAGIQYKQPSYMYTEFNNFYNQVGTGYVWNNIRPIGKSFITGGWNEDNDVLRTILTTQLYQYGEDFINAENESFTNLTGSLLINEIRNNPQKLYILSFYSKKTNGKDFNHAVVPYKVEGNKIYVWDNIYPYINNNDAYNQYIELNSNGTWSSNTHTDVLIEKISLVDILDIDDLNLIAPTGFNGTDQSFTLSGSSDLIVRDSLGRISGFQNGNIIEEIPGVKVYRPYNMTGEENTLKEVNLTQKQSLEVIVSGRISESYKLMIAGGDYYASIDGVTTSSGQIDTYLSTRQNLKIDFDNSKTGSYNLRVNNFNNGTGTVYMEGIPSIGEKQKYDIDWTKVINDDNDSVIYSMDVDNDGDYENEEYLPSKYQYIIPTMLRLSPSNEEK